MGDKTCITVGELKEFIKYIPDDTLISSIGGSRDILFSTKYVQNCPINHLTIVNGDSNNDLLKGIKEKLLIDFKLDNIKYPELYKHAQDNNIDLGCFNKKIHRFLPLYNIDGPYLSELEIYAKYPFVPKKIG